MDGTTFTCSLHRHRALSLCLSPTCSNLTTHLCCSILNGKNKTPFQKNMGKRKQNGFSKIMFAFFFFFDPAFFSLLLFRHGIQCHVFINIYKFTFACLFFSFSCLFCTISPGIACGGVKKVQKAIFHRRQLEVVFVFYFLLFSFFSVGVCMGWNLGGVLLGQ